MTKSRRSSKQDTRSSSTQEALELVELATSSNSAIDGGAVDEFCDELTFHWKPADENSSIPSIEEQLSGIQRQPHQRKRNCDIPAQAVERPEEEENEGVDPYNTGRFDAGNIKKRSR